jgi:pyruvate dehydrogenase E2 component (dihydrolipoamide acetyltransferase)
MTDVVMPQMGESIVEGTLTRWLKKPGEQVERDEPLFEISTDKVDTEIPSPAAGVLSEILVQEGTTVAINFADTTVSPAAATCTAGCTAFFAPAGATAASGLEPVSRRSRTFRAGERDVTSCNSGSSRGCWSVPKYARSSGPSRPERAGRWK